MPTPSTPPATLTGVVERIIFLNEDNHYTIAEFQPDQADPKSRPEAGPSWDPCPGWSAARPCT